MVLKCMHLSALQQKLLALSTGIVHKELFQFSARIEEGLPLRINSSSSSIIVVVVVVIASDYIRIAAASCSTSTAAAFYRNKIEIILGHTLFTAPIIFSHFQFSNRHRCVLLDSFAT